jgi:hypothetical protein
MYIMHQFTSLLKRQITRRDRLHEETRRKVLVFFFFWRGKSVESTMDTSTLTQIFGVIGSSYIRDSRSLHLFFQYLIYYWYQMSYLSDFWCCQQVQETLRVGFRNNLNFEALKLVSWLDWSQCQVFNVGNFADPKIIENLVCDLLQDPD